jgi:hypothetical protein
MSFLEPFHNQIDQFRKHRVLSRWSAGASCRNLRQINDETNLPRHKYQGTLEDDAWKKRRRCM